jgi:hypothetical protein
MAFGQFGRRFMETSAGNRETVAQHEDHGFPFSAFTTNWRRFQTGLRYTSMIMTIHHLQSSSMLGIHVVGSITNQCLFSIHYIGAIRDLNYHAAYWYVAGEVA